MAPSETQNTQACPSCVKVFQLDKLGIGNQPPHPSEAAPGTGFARRRIGFTFFLKILKKWFVLGIAVSIVVQVSALIGLLSTPGTDEWAFQILLCLAAFVPLFWVPWFIADRRGLPHNTTRTIMFLGFSGILFAPLWLAGFIWA